MAEIPITGRSGTIRSQDTYVLADASKTNVASIAVHLVPSTSPAWSGTIRVKSRSREAPTSVTHKQVPYLKRYLNGAAADDTLVTTDITGESIIIIPASGQNIALDCTTFSDGTMTAYVTKLDGAAA